MKFGAPLVDVANEPLIKVVSDFKSTDQALALGF
jgi:hypothetical protein